RRLVWLNESPSAPGSTWPKLWCALALAGSNRCSILGFVTRPPSGAESRAVSSEMARVITKTRVAVNVGAASPADRRTYGVPLRRGPVLRLPVPHGAPDPSDLEAVRRWVRSQPGPTAIDLFCGAGGLS